MTTVVDEGFHEPSISTRLYARPLGGTALPLGACTALTSTAVISTSSTFTGRFAFGGLCLFLSLGLEQFLNGPHTPAHFTKLRMPTPDTLKVCVTSLVCVRIVVSELVMKYAEVILHLS